MHWPDFSIGIFLLHHNLSKTKKPILPLLVGVHLGSADYVMDEVLRTGTW